RAEARPASAEVLSCARAFARLGRDEACREGTETVLQFSKMYVLGIDAGGKKTMCLLADGDGRIIGEARGGGANLQASGELEVEKVLHQVMDAGIGDRGGGLSSICLGIAGVDRPDDTAAVQSIMRRIGFKAQVIVVHDALVALCGGGGRGPGGGG